MTAKLSPTERRILADLPAFRTAYARPYENVVADGLVTRGLAVRQAIPGTTGYEYQQTRKAPGFLAQHGEAS